MTSLQKFSLLQSSEIYFIEKNGILNSAAADAIAHTSRSTILAKGESLSLASVVSTRSLAEIQVIDASGCEEVKVLHSRRSWLPAISVCNQTI
jgi:hypothetical protein